MVPKSENVEKQLVLPLLFEGSTLPRGDSENERTSEPRGPTSKKRRCVIKDASCRSS